MGVNVFGTPVTVSSVKLMEKYRNRDATITRHDLAKVAMEQKNAGEPVRFHDSREWAGSLYESHYPIIIANGQWGAFLHRSSSGETETAGGFIYEGNNWHGEAVHWVTAFETYSTSRSRIRLEITTPIYYSSNWSWGTVKEEVSFTYTSKNHCYLDNTEGAAMYGCIGNGDTSMLEVVLTLPCIVNSWY